MCTIMSVNFGNQNGMWEAAEMMLGKEFLMLMYY